MAFLLAAACATACASTIYSDFSCDTLPGAEATMMDYSYLEEPKLVDNHYTNGLKSGAFNYLVNGEFDYGDYYGYYDGQKDPDHKLISEQNASLVHDLSVYFEGEKSISEFYGKGFFINYRALSAWKKIRYEDVSKYDLGESYMAPAINVRGTVAMGPTDETDKLGRLSSVYETEADETESLYDGDYDFSWDAAVTEGVIEVWDATGWTNRSGSNRIDWERTSLIKGSVNVTNSLYSTNLYIPAAGPEDWLGCCFGGFSDIYPTDLGSVDISCIKDGCPPCCKETKPECPSTEPNCAECPRLT